MNSTESSSKVSLATKLSFGFGGFGKDFGMSVVSVLLLFYYTDVAGVSPIFVGTVFLVARIWDAVNDPMLGYIVNNTKTRWGRYKPWIFFGNLLNAGFTIALFSAHHFTGTAQLIFIAITYIGWGMTYTMLDAPFWSLIPTITLDKKERERLMPYPRLFASGAYYFASGMGIVAVNKLGQGDDAHGFFLYAVISAVLAIASATVTCLWTKQSVKDDPSQQNTINIKEAIKYLLKNDQFVALLSVALIFNIANGFFNGLHLYFYKYVLGDETLFSTFMVLTGVFGILAIIAFPNLASRFGRAKLFSASLLLPAASSAILFITANFAQSSQILITLAGALAGISTGLYWLMIFLMIADTVDYGDLRLGKRCESVCYSVQTFAVKCTGAFTGFLVGGSLAIINYVPNEVQTPEAVTGLQLLYLAPSALCIVAYIAYRKFYTLNGAVLDSVQHELEGKYNPAAAS
ncbi:melibiose:sodium transporter MelB [Photobacterium rosenbergii]|uniref:Melibiose:sodium transporter MelB n=1 Tax=Photobacterium rosenbergii TaxID=294936 RepID=A0A2T3N9Q2_9GAMM|nr:melibiose:sodium transporter MelB [Photobacterium rosenbergii]PSW10247.1 melibiose:sodium transporter MelB [Photobacterium rosenbergii]